MGNEQTLASGGAQRGKIGQRVAYAFGNLGQSAFYNALSTYFIVYVTSCLFSGVEKGVAAKLIGVITSLVVIIRIAEIFIDPLLGNIVDNTTTKWGRFRPWQFLGGLVSALLLVVIYTGMFGLVNVNTTWFIVLFVICFVVLDVFYSLRDISYWGMIPALSSDSHERSTYTALGSFTGSIGYNGITVVVIPIVTYFSWVFTGSHAESQSGWTAFGIIVGLLGILTAWSVAFGTKESQSALRSKAQKNGGPLQAFKALFQNDQLLWVALSYLLYAIANVATTGVLIFLFKFVLDNQAAYSMTGIIALVAGLVMAPLYPILNKRIPRRYLYIGGMTSMIIAYIMLGIFSNNMIMVFVALVLFYVPGTMIQMTAILSLTDSIEYGQLKNGKRNEAVTLSVRPMLDKIGGAMSNGIVGFIAIAAGMTGDATAADMTAANINTFKTCAFYVPLVLIVLSLLVFMFKVKISEKMHDDIVKQLEAKLAAGEIESDDESSADVEDAPAEAAGSGAAASGSAA
ncbi:glycoside-pentoside-hexuronide (GPH):cation symporter [Bifidobacterium angulatum]|jgi:lactose/raffinose/galactose permease|uniref:Transporter, major facilitator family protein n=1 Tax=Bifidobacterium angulatum DSM 20098 = JCM 7096 TaxID=518635 RepID=C4FDD0_9BIFI|nr:glycoside-pentoside-hexuronide (GPH):cation symporter [Bifidobacterium angulatum]EEP20961.1 transporter, major facilitator family protein [Bifidobacterium angulatum DSM 20098 = JCM 7096]KFI39552.1 galactoside symporter [Bifidobacterium angulatum]BAQ95684.1 galactoside transport protein [Bifidobacterium angulatum DSM 20098 = JCM 7096]